MSRNSHYLKGAWNVTCDRCGLKIKSTEARKTWDGYYVCQRHWEPRSPLDFPVSVRDDTSVPYVRSTPLVISVPDAPGSPNVNFTDFPSRPIAVLYNYQASISFSTPNNGGSQITGFTVKAYESGVYTGHYFNGSSSPINTTGLAGMYTFTVTATNGVGNSLESAASNSVTIAAVPATPAAPVAVGGDGQAVVTLTAPSSDGGSAITGYTVTSIPAGGTDTNAGQSVLTHVITGLTNGTPYDFTFHATNGVGNSLESAASNSVTPHIVVTWNPSDKGSRIVLSDNNLIATGS